MAARAESPERRESRGGRNRESAGGENRIGPLRAWLIGARVHTLPAAAAPVLIGGGLAHAAGGFALLPFAAAFVGAVLIQIGTNFANDYHDFERGADAEDRLGFVRVTQAGLASPRRVRNWMLGAFGGAVGVGVYLVFVGGWPILAIGAASIVAGVAYTGGPWPFGYHGLGDPLVFLFFGLVAVFGTYWVQVLGFATDTLLAGAGVGALCTAILVVNNLRDIRTDGRAGKRTMAVRLGVGGTRAEYAALVVVALTVPPAGMAFFDWSAGVLLACLALGALWRPWRTVWGYRDPRELNAALARTGRVTGWYGLLFALGLAL